MSAYSSAFAKIMMTKAGATPTDLSPTAITKADPAVVTATVTGVSDGDLVYISGTGFESIDGQYWIVDNIAAGTFELLGSDSSGETGTFTAATAKAEHYVSSDLVRLCLSNWSPSVDSPSTVSVATYCQPSASLASAVSTAGTVDFGVYTDPADSGFLELLKAEADRKERVFMISYPTIDGYYMIYRGVVASISEEMPIDGGVGNSGQIILSVKPARRF